MPRYSPNGHGHQSLRHLSRNPATLSELRQALDLQDRAAIRREHWYALRALLHDGLIHMSAGVYAITTNGEDALEVLEGGQEANGPARTSVRVFARREAA